MRGPFLDLLVSTPLRSYSDSIQGGRNKYDIRIHTRFYRFLGLVSSRIVAAARHVIADGIYGVVHFVAGIHGPKYVRS